MDRTHTWGELRIENVNKQDTLAGRGQGTRQLGS